MRNMLALAMKQDQDMCRESSPDRAALYVERMYCDSDQDYFECDDEYYYGWGIDLDRAWADHRRRDALGHGVAGAVTDGWL